MAIKRKPKGAHQLPRTHEELAASNPALRRWAYKAAHRAENGDTSEVTLAVLRASVKEAADRAEASSRERRAFADRLAALGYAPTL